MFKRIFLLITVALLLVAFAVAPAIALLPNGQQAPNFQLADLAGTMHSLTDYRGKVVVIDFFSVSCSACKSSATNDLVPLYNSYYRDDARVQFLGIEVSGASAAETNSQFVKPTGITWPVLVGGTSNLLNSDGSTSVPTVYVLDFAGKVALATTSIDSSTLKSTIDKLTGSGSGTGTGPAVCSQDANSLDVFVQGTDHALWYKHLDGASWGSWKSLGGVLTSDPAAVSRSAGKIDVFVPRRRRRPLVEVYHGRRHLLVRPGTRSAGSSSPAPARAAYAWGDARIGVVVTGTNKALYHIWNERRVVRLAKPSADTLTSSPAATSPTTGVIDVYGRGSDGALYKMHYSGGVWGSVVQDRRAAPQQALALPRTNWGSTRTGWFVTGTNNALYHTWNDGTAHMVGKTLAGYLTSSPGAISKSAGTIDVFVRGGDGALWGKSYASSSANGWGAWSEIGGQLA